tara:strand:+ start:1565 stop:1897 length:333 start_codon:yes stop_codon:yes gene_type:complete
MNRFPENLRPENVDETFIKNALHVHYMELLRNDIYIHILTSDIHNDFFSILDFFNKHEISDTYKETITSDIISELTENGWFIKKLFNDTAILIAKSQDNLNTSIWSSTLE